MKHKDSDIVTEIQENKYSFLSKSDHNNLEGFDKREPEDLLVYESLRITNKTPISIPQPIVTINGEIVATCEDLLTLSGASKSGKSAFLSVLIAMCISPNGKILDGFPEVEVLPNINRHAVLHFDTEQARHKQQYNVNTILKRANFQDCPNYFLSYNLRKLDLDEYQPKVNGICEAAYNKFKGIHSIFIDGGADFVQDVNDPSASNAIVKYFEELAIKYSTAICIVIHTNPGSDKERGHLGSQFQRKCGSLLTVKSEDNYSYLEPKILRYGGVKNIPNIMFQYSPEKGYHVPFGIKNEEFIEDTKKAKKNTSAWKLCQKVFAGLNGLTYEEAKLRIMKVRGCEDRTAKKEFTFMKANEMILKGADKNWRLNSMFNNDL